MRLDFDQSNGSSSLFYLLARLGLAPRFHLPPSPSKKMMISPQFSTYGCFTVFEWVISSLCSFQVASGCSLIANVEHQILCCISVLIVWSSPIHFIFIHSYCIFFVRISTFSSANINYYFYIIYNIKKVKRKERNYTILKTINYYINLILVRGLFCTCRRGKKKKASHRPFALDTNLIRGKNY